MPVDVLIQQIETVYQRVFALYRDVSLNINTELIFKSDVLPLALKELGIASEELQVAAEELNQQSEELVATRVTIEAESHHYQNLFEFAPDGYLVTDFQGVIHQANQAIARLLSCTKEFLSGKPLAIFIVETERQPFRSKLSYLHQSRRVQEIETRMQPRSKDAFNAALTVTTMTNSLGEPAYLCWLVRRSARHSLLPNLEENHNPIRDYPLHRYTRGEVIPLKLQEICWVCQGWVKLSTFSGTGKEILMGLAGSSMVFGSLLTSMQLYQAIALSDVQLVYIPLEQVNSSLQLARLVLPGIAQRLKQTEHLLLISGQPRVKDRLWELLLLLKQEIGEPAEEGGVRLGIRLTHEDLASACCTTRVTVTRLLTPFLQTGQISLDKHCIILHDLD
ncbi:MAG: helix-turn-helix domain-containing protein [Leptolyngbyaceae cyanobacterium SM1_4_3]|nr:helix-turn-helix domain-containing protein [Leptolyngbyaceae cyanobacterium SM1_4_3]